MVKEREEERGENIDHQSVSHAGTPLHSRGIQAHRRICVFQQTKIKTAWIWMLRYPAPSALTTGSSITSDRIQLKWSQLLFREQPRPRRLQPDSAAVRDPDPCARPRCRSPALPSPPPPPPPVPVSVGLRPGTSNGGSRTERPALPERGKPHHCPSNARTTNKDSCTCPGVPVPFPSAHRRPGLWQQP